jgi:uncharacterized DUF497 family protein
MKFEFDPRKSVINKRKHGIDFNQIMALWDDPFTIEIPARTLSEARYIVTGQVKDKYWSVVITYRDGNTRLISARRSWKKEIDAYEKNRSH